MYEVLDIPKMMKVKAPHIRNRSRIPKDSGGKHKQKWGGLILVRAGLSKEQMNLIPDGSSLRMCYSDPSVWEVYVPASFKHSKKLLAKRLNAVAFM